MRFAWLRQHSSDPNPIKQMFYHPSVLLRFLYNLIFWVCLLPYFTSMSYSTGFLLFGIIILIRLAANLYANHRFTLPEEFEQFPFRSPG